MRGAWRVVVWVVIGFLIVFGVYLVGGRTKHSSPEPSAKEQTTALGIEKIDRLSIKSADGQGLKEVSQNKAVDKNTFKIRLSKLREEAARDPHNAMRWIEIAKLYDTVGEHYKAYEYLRKALEMDPNFKYKEAVQEVITDYERNVLHKSDH